MMSLSWVFSLWLFPVLPWTIFGPLDVPLAPCDCPATACIYSWSVGSHWCHCAPRRSDVIGMRWRVRADVLGVGASAPSHLFAHTWGGNIRQQLPTLLQRCRWSLYDIKRYVFPASSLFISPVGVYTFLYTTLSFLVYVPLRVKHVQAVFDLLNSSPVDNHLTLNSQSAL